MNKRVLYPASMIALAAGLSASAQAQTVTSATLTGAPITANFGFSSDGSPATITNTDPVDGLYDSTYLQTGTVLTWDDSNTATVNGVTLSEIADVVYDATETTVTHVDTNVPANTTSDPTVLDMTGGTATYLSVGGSTSEGTPITSTTITTDNTTPTDNIVNLTQSVSSIGTSGITFANYAGTAEYVVVDSNNPDGNYVDVQFDSTMTSGTTLDASGLTTTGSVNASTVNTAQINGTGTNGSLTLHGGSASTTVNIDDNGFAVDLNDDGEPDFGALIDGSGNISGGIRGDWGIDGNTEIGGTLEVSGQTTTNGITNNGVIKTTGLNVTGAISNTAVPGTPDAAPVVIADNLVVTGTLNMLGNKITNVAAGTAGTDAVNLNQLNGEVTRATAAEAVLQSNITAETNARIAADTAETNARIAADNALGTRITNETNDRIAADNLLRDQIASSTATAIALGGATILPDTNFTLSGNVGFYQGAQAVALNAAARVAPNAYVTGAFGGGLNKNGKVGGRVGVVFGF